MQDVPIRRSHRRPTPPPLEAVSVPRPSDPPLSPLPGIELPEIDTPEPAEPLDPEWPSVPAEPAAPDRELEPA